MRIRLICIIFAIQTQNRMAQLQLYTTKTRRGFATLVNINPSEDVMRYIHDYSSALRILHYNPAEKQYFLLLRYIDSGLLLTVLRPIIGDEHDNYAATLYIPNGMQIATEDILNTISTVKEFLNGKDPSSADIADMRRFLSKDYPIERKHPHRQQSSGNLYAYALYNGTDKPSLSDYADSEFYQPKFSDYAGVFLLDSQLLVSADIHAADLTKPHLTRLLRVNPPLKSPQGFVAYLGRRQFASPILAGEGCSLDIMWQKGGFETLSTPFIVEKDNETPPAPNTSSARRIITPSSFHITEERNQQQASSNFTIKVNGIEIDGPKAFTFSDLKNARVEISAPGYVTFSGNYDLASTSLVLVQMHSLHKTYRFELPLKTPEPSEPAHICIKTKKALHRSPIEGYEVAGGQIIDGSGVSNKLEFNGSNTGRPYTHIIAVAVAGIVVGIIAGILIGFLCFSSKGAEDIATASAENPTVESPAPRTVEKAAEPVAETVEIPTPKPSGVDAVKYLDENQVWRRAEMEEIPGLEGLFDDLNSYNFEQLSSTWSKRIEGSKNFDAVMRAVAGAPTKRDPRRADHNPVYKADSTAINWLSYTYWIDP